MSARRRPWPLIPYTLGWFLFLGLLPALGRFLPRLRAWQEGRARGLQPAPPGGRTVIWMHCASLGEFEQGRPVLDALRAARPDAWIVLTFFSPSGFDRRRDYPSADQVLYLPADTPSSARRFLDALRPDLVLWVKYDFWFNHWWEIRARGIPILLFAARFRPDQWLFRPWAGAFRSLILGANRIGVQSDMDRQVLSAYVSGNVFLSGDPRADRVSDLPREDLDEPWLETFVRGAPGVLVAGSVWDEDIDLLRLARQAGVLPGWKWIIAPHDLAPTRVERYRAAFGAESLRYTTDRGTSIGEADVLILDTIGLLNRVYRLGDLTYVGGGWGRSVHNLLEPAAYGKPVLFGPAHHKFPEGEALIRGGGGFSIPDREGFFRRLALWSDPRARQEAGKCASAVVTSLSGGTARVLRESLALLEPAPSPAGHPG